MGKYISRHLELQLHNPPIDDPVFYGDVTGLLNLRIVHIEVFNRRPDVSALDCVARLVSVEQSIFANQPSPNQSPLKASDLAGINWPPIGTSWAGAILKYQAVKH
jgi:hypothetical protein